MIFDSDIVFRAPGVYYNIPELQKAGDMGHTEAQLSLAVLYENGVRADASTWTLKPDAQQAFALAQKVAQKGYAPAQKTLSRYYLTGVGVAPNKEAGDTWHNAYRISTEDFSDSDVFVEVGLGRETPHPPGATSTDSKKPLEYSRIMATPIWNGRR